MRLLLHLVTKSGYYHTSHRDFHAVSSVPVYSRHDGWLAEARGRISPYALPVLLLYDNQMWQLSERWKCDTIQTYNKPINHPAAIEMFHPRIPSFLSVLNSQGHWSALGCNGLRRGSGACDVLNKAFISVLICYWTARLMSRIHFWFKHFLLLYFYVCTQMLVPGCNSKCCFKMARRGTNKVLKSWKYRLALGQIFHIDIGISPNLHMQGLKQRMHTNTSDWCRILHICFFDKL